MSRFIQIVEVGPRDGLQNEKQSLTVPEKLDMIRRLEGQAHAQGDLCNDQSGNRPEIFQRGLHGGRRCESE